MEINTEYWGQPLSEYWGYNERNGASDLADPDFEDYPPFIRNNMNPDFVDPLATTATYSLRAAIAKTGSAWVPEQEYPDYSIAYVGIKNKNLPQTNVVCVGQSPSTQSGEVDFSECFVSDPKEILPVAFASNRPMRSYRSVNTYTVPTKTFYNFIYQNSKGQYTNGKRCYSPHYTDNDSSWPSRNTSLDCSYWRSLGLRTFFGVIYVQYCDATLDANGISTKMDYNPVTLYWYENQTAEWREAHPIHKAFMRMCIRYNTSGLYNFSHNPGDGIQPDYMYNLRVNPVAVPSGNTEMTFHAPAVLFGDGNDWSDWPLFGYTGTGNVGQIGTTPSTGGMPSGQYPMFIGYNMGTFHSGSPEAASSYQRTCWITYEDDDYEWIRQAAAAYGFFFTDGDTDDTGYSQLFAEGNDNTRWTDDKMCLGKVNAVGWTDGSYSHGSANASQRNYVWKDTTQSPFNPARKFNVYIGDDPVQNIFIGDTPLTALFNGDSPV